MARFIYKDDEWEKKFGVLPFHLNDKREVLVNPLWVQENIIAIELPILVGHKFQVNKMVAKDLTRIFTQIEQQGLDKYINVLDTNLNGGSYCPRWNVANKTKLSRHSWGCPFDLNPTANAFGTVGNMNTGIIKIFNDNGWAWFGDVGAKDPMHFEICRVA